VSVARLIRYEAAGPEGSQSPGSRVLARGSRSVSSDHDAWRLRPNTSIRRELPGAEKPLFPELGRIFRGGSRFSWPVERALGRRKDH
jgi:hypothetical protein